MLEVEGGEFVSPLERDGEAGEAVEASEPVNTFPVLVGDGDQAVLGAAIMLPDHPELAPESLGNLFDNTEIEEALLLHVQTLSDYEREGIAEQDPAVREMIERADNVSNDEMLSLHGRLTYKEPEDDADEGETTNGTQLVPPAGIDVTPGEQELELGPRSVRLGDKVVLRPGTEGDVFDKILHGRTATVERIYKGYDERVYLGVTVDDDPGQDLLRDTGRYLFFFADEVEVPDRVSGKGGRQVTGPDETREERIMLEQAARRAGEQELDSRMDKQILVAGVGNAWLGDDGFGGAVIRGLEERELPSGVKVQDFGSGGLDLAYEVMRGYHALLLIDVSKQGGEPGTLYVIEPDPDEIAGGIEDGEVLSPHGMDPATVLRFVKAVHGWPGKVVVVACEPADVEEMAMELTPEVEAAVENAVDLVLEQLNLLQSDEAYQAGGS